MLIDASIISSNLFSHTSLFNQIIFNKHTLSEATKKVQDKLRDKLWNFQSRQQFDYQFCIMQTLQAFLIRHLSKKRGSDRRRRHRRRRLHWIFVIIIYKPGK